jgi:hypothetical protein
MMTFSQRWDRRFRLSKTRPRSGAFSAGQAVSAVNVWGRRLRLPANQEAAQ